MSQLRFLIAWHIALLAGKLDETKVEIRTNSAVRWFIERLHDLAEIAAGYRVAEIYNREDC